MKFFFALLGIVGAGFLGYTLEPDMRYSLTGIEPATIPAGSSDPKPVAVTPVAPQPQAYDYSKLLPNQLPAKVVLKSQASAKAPGGEDELPLPPGTKVNPVRIEGDSLVFSVLGTAEGKILVSNTNLVEILLANPPPAPTTTPTTTPVVANNNTPDAPSPPPVTAPQPTHEPAPMPDPAPAPTPDPTPAPTPVASNLSPDDIVNLMKESVGSGRIKEFTVSQVSGWKATEDEVIDGEKFQTGLAAYKAETIFGVKNVQAKALIKDGKVVRWIWPTSGLEIE